MKFDERENLIAALNEIERTFPVDQWQIREVDIWPVLKQYIFFAIFDRSNPQTRRQASCSLVSRISRRLVRWYSAVRGFLTLNLEPVPAVFAGAIAHRVSWNGQFINRYFDPMMDHLQDLGKESYLFETAGIGSMKLYEEKRVRDLATLLPLFNTKRNLNPEWSRLLQAPEFSAFVNVVEREFSITPKTLETRLLNVLNSIFNWEALYSFVLRKTRPSFAFLLCYYSIPMYGLILAAKKRKIVTIDMQHGSQGKLHPCYYFNKLPNNSFTVLPDQFWCWDAESVKAINEWTENSPISARLSGNPWFQFIHREETSRSGPIGKPVLLYTLQPLNPIIDPFMITAIKSSSREYSWWIRFHPRMTDAERKEFFHILSVSSLTTEVNTADANNLPLPVIFSFARVHVSKYSGSISEAAIAGVPSLIIDRIGVETFTTLIENGKSIGLDEMTSDDVLQKISELLKVKDNLQRVDTDFKETMTAVVSPKHLSIQTLQHQYDK